MDRKKKNQFEAGDSLVKNAPAHVKLLHSNFKKGVRAKQRQDFMRNVRAGNQADFGS